MHQPTHLICCFALCVHVLQGLEAKLAESQARKAELEAETELVSHKRA